ncbi:V8-like Glu-specific endopeptidase [Acidovorax delafieldii]|uniref:pre-peptidase C-terminal domain-containing protein n=1 Tax=Acidovorax delafieldii TaxID=47920 RepID=UPI00285531F2|nr:pre-peptidase C-terminal domain-containing protein [Acidovorax delafieldii]MDR6155132.1 V8-like Glu-specific endopeptidase [Acidovorax delafieldii]
MYEIVNRTADPYRAICYVTCTWSDGSRTSGSGVVVGINDVLTAMHVVYDAQRGGWAQQISVSPAADTKPYLVQPLGEYTNWGRITSRTSNWDQDGDGLLSAAESQWDLAVIGLRSRIGDVTGWVGTSSFGASTVGEVVGYPSRGTGMMGQQVYANASSSYGVFEVSYSLGPGASGGPLLQTVANGDVYALGVLSAGDTQNSTYAALYGRGTWDWFMAALEGNNDLIGGSGGTGAGAGSGGGGGAIDDYAASAQTLGVVAVGGRAVGALERAGDVDWFKVSLATGKYRFEVLGSDAGLGTLGDPAVKLLTAGGALLAANDDGPQTFDSLLEFTVTTAGTYYLAVSAAERTPAATLGTYTVRVTSLAGGVGAGTAGPDVAFSTARNERFDGDAGIDRWVLDGVRTDYQVTRTSTNEWTVSDRVAGRDGVDTLLSVERLQFADRGLALDLQVGESAGRAALALGAAVGPQALKNTNLVTAWLKFFDEGKTITQAAQTLLDTGAMAALAGGADNASFVQMLYRNVIGEPASAITTAVLSQYLDGGLLTRADMFRAIAELPVNQAHIDLVGLQKTGLEYAL